MARDGLGAHWGSGVSQAKPRTKSVGFVGYYSFGSVNRPFFLSVCVSKIKLQRRNAKRRGGKKRPDRTGGTRNSTQNDGAARFCILSGCTSGQGNKSEIRVEGVQNTARATTNDAGRVEHQLVYKPHRVAPKENDEMTQKLTWRGAR